MTMNRSGFMASMGVLFGASMLLPAKQGYPVTMKPMSLPDVDALTNAMRVHTFTVLKYSPGTCGCIRDEHGAYERDEQGKRVLCDRCKAYGIDFDMRTTHYKKHLDRNTHHGIKSRRSKEL